MEKLTILCIDDQRDVLAALRKDLESLNEFCRFEFCESADEAEEVLDELDAEVIPLAVIVCDHIMPGKNGVEFLIEFNGDARFEHTRKFLLTGMATHDDTITAINQAQINHYIEKPWEKEQILEVVKILITEFVMSVGMEYQSYLSILHQQTLYKYLRT